MILKVHEYLPFSFGGAVAAYLTWARWRENEISISQASTAPLFVKDPVFILKAAHKK
jgi:hypothetical protein